MVSTSDLGPNVPVVVPIEPTYEYDAAVVRFLDGDTLDVSIDLGFKIFVIQRVRVYGLNCRELHSTNPKEKELGQGDLAYAEGLAPSGSAIKLRSHKAGKEKYGRYLAEIHLPDGTDFAQRMIAAEHGTPYFGGPRD